MGRRKSEKPKTLQNTQRPNKNLPELIEKIKELGGTIQGFQACINSYGCTIGLQSVRDIFQLKLNISNFNLLMIGLYLRELNAGNQPFTN